MAPSPIIVDDSLWPLIIVRFERDPSAQEFAEYLARRSMYLERPEQTVSILDASRVRTGTAEQRQLQAEWIKRNAALLRQRSLGSAHIISSPVIRLVTSLILHVQPIPTPHIVVSGMNEAVAWALKRLEGAGDTLAAERVRHHFGLRAGGADLRE
jgi:hypothetical protein